MQLLGRWTRPLCAALLSLSVAAAPLASGALTLSGLAGGGSFSAGALTFSNFEVTIGGGLSLDFGDYPVQVLGDGFRLSGPLSVLLGDTGSLLLSYDVTTGAPGGILGARLYGDGNTIGAGAQAYVGESLFGPGSTPLGSLFVYSVTGVGEQVSDAIALAGPTTLHVVKTVVLRSGVFTALPFVDQRFVVVPEPYSLLTMTVGLTGLALLGRRRA